MSAPIRITRALLRKWDACYSDERIAALVPEEGLTPLQVLDLDIPAEDRLVVLREEVIPARELRLLAAAWAERACRAAGVTDHRSWAAISTARRYALGEATSEELAAASDAASDAAWVAARAAARAAASDAARAAAWAAARAAAWAAASDAARAAAWAAARDAQIEDVRRVLGDLARHRHPLDAAACAPEETP